MHTRREFLNKCRLAGSAAVALPILAARGAETGGASAAPNRPNILWITCEDLSPNMIGCFGNPGAATPNLDRLAKRGTRFTRVFTTAPVCSPSRSSIILGAYPTCTGSQNLRSAYGLPERFHGFPSYLRQAGYYRSNRSKTDYNTAEAKQTIEESWDFCGADAHWRGRRREQPFFAVFNFTITHQSKGGFIDPSLLEEPIFPGAHDPADVDLPPYYPDTKTVRRTLANYSDKATAMDRQAGSVLKDLEADGLAEDTIVFFFSDHGTGLPRGKRVIYDSGLQTPLIVSIPTKFADLAIAPPGGVCDRLISFIDFAPTVLSLAGIAAPSQMQGQAFLGPHAGAARTYVHGARDRVDEAFDMARSVRDRRFLYVRHYCPHVSWNAPEAFSDRALLRQEITRLAREGKLNDAQMTYAGPRKPVEELFDSDADPHQVHNLAADPAHRETLDRMRSELRRWLLEIRDTGFMPEEEMARVTEAGGTPWDLARDDAAYPLERILDAADLVGREEAASRQADLLTDPIPFIRFWAARSLAAAGEAARPALHALRKAMADDSAPVRIEAAGAVLALESDAAAIETLTTALLSGGACVWRAARALELLGEKARPALPAIRQVLAEKPSMYTSFALTSLLTSLGEQPPPARRRETRAKKF